MADARPPIDAIDDAGIKYERATAFRRLPASQCLLITAPPPGSAYCWRALLPVVAITHKYAMESYRRAASFAAALFSVSGLKESRGRDDTLL